MSTGAELRARWVALARLMDSVNLENVQTVSVLTPPAPYQAALAMLTVIVRLATASSHRV